MFVIPKAGLNFRDPHSGARVPSEGMEVPDGSLEWARILADGDAEQGEPPAEALAEAPPEPEAAAADAQPDKKTKAQAPAAAQDGAQA